MPKHPISLAVHVVVHPDYNEHDIDYDFTLVKLARPVELGLHLSSGRCLGTFFEQEYSELWSNQGYEEAYGNPK